MRSTHFFTYMLSYTSALRAAIRPSITTAAYSSKRLPISIIWFYRRYYSLIVDTLVRTTLSDQR